MTNKEILSITAHRPWTLPTERWRYCQEWNHAVFLHWQVNFQELRRMVPKDLEIDLYEGQPWVSMVAFKMQKIPTQYLPSFSPISDFEEVNIRTYVKKDGKGGVYFLSIEGGNPVSCWIAKTISGLPYRHSTIKSNEISYRSENNKFKDKMNITFEVAQKQREKTKLDVWLTERYAVFLDTETSIDEFEIHHIEWPLYELDINEIELRFPRFKKLLNNSPIRRHYSPGVQVIAWDKKTTHRTYNNKRSTSSRFK